MISQETANCFIKQLSDEYKDYIDIAQPVQVAVYEMKLGLSLILSGILCRIEFKDVNQVMVLHPFMMFYIFFFPTSMNLFLAHRLT